MVSLNFSQRLGPRGWLYAIEAADAEGNPALFFLRVSRARKKDFEAQLTANTGIDLQAYGDVLASCYGNTVSDEAKAVLQGLGLHPENIALLLKD